MRTSDRRTTRRYERRQRDQRAQRNRTDQVDQLATGLGDAVERLVRAFDPAARPGIGDLFGDPIAPQGRCPRCGRTDCCSSCCDHHHHHDHHHDDHHHDDHHHDDHHHDDHHHGHGCGCHACSCDRCPPRCGPDSCTCSCCIGDADVVVYARVGEQRVVPITIENHRKRERVIKMQLAEFRSKGGRDTPVKAKLITAAEFTLGPCEQHEGIIVISAGAVGREEPQTYDKTGDEVDLDSLTKAELIEEADRIGVAARTNMTKSAIIDAIAERPTAIIVDRPTDFDRPDFDLPDVDDCHVAVADLCIEGCDSRPIRIAVALLPRVCNSFDIHCDCACC